MKKESKFLMHVFCHRKTPYFFETINEDDWMSRYFFSGGIMPSDQLPFLIDSKLNIEKSISRPQSSIDSQDISDAISDDDIEEDLNLESANNNT